MLVPTETKPTSSNTSFVNQKREEKPITNTPNRVNTPKTDSILNDIFCQCNITTDTIDSILSIEHITSSDSKYYLTTIQDSSTIQVILQKCSCYRATKRYHSLDHLNKLKHLLIACLERSTTTATIINGIIQVNNTNTIERTTKRKQSINSSSSTINTPICIETTDDSYIDGIKYFTFNLHQITSTLTEESIEQLERNEKMVQQCFSNPESTKILSTLLNTI
ncbi:hypothetical protein NEOKW01_0108 [Nematocida sp. AWRm80]|nr:hypothetical protein NEOKW01_0108 [Nematocida sp. AWRm80]